MGKFSLALMMTLLLLLAAFALTLTLAVDHPWLKSKVVFVVAVVF